MELCNLLVVLCVVVFLLSRRVPLHIRISSEARQRLQLLRTERPLNVDSWLRALIDEALDREFGPAPKTRMSRTRRSRPRPPNPSLDGLRPS